MNAEAILYVPSDTPEAMTMATHKVAGVPLIVRGIMTLAQAGIGRCILLIARTQHEKIERFLARYRDKPMPRIDIIHYEEPYCIGPDTAKKIGEEMDARCLIINANFIFEKELVLTVRGIPMDDGQIIFCREGAHPLPIYDISRSSWLALADPIAQKPKSIEGCLRHIVEVSEPVFTSKNSTINTFLVTHDRDMAVAEKSLVKAIRYQIDGPVAKFINKRISLPVSLLLSKLWISPNTITAVNIIIGVFSGVFVADGHRYAYILFGAILFQIASIVDGCDGEVAKLTFRCSRFGQYADTLCDNLSLGSFLIGLIAGYWRHTHSPMAFVIGALMISTTAITFFWMVRYLKNNTQSASLVTFDKQYLQKLDSQPGWLLTLIKYGKYTLKKDMFSFAFLCFAIFGVLYWCLFIATLGTTIAAIILTCLNLQEMLNHPSRSKSLRSKLLHADIPLNNLLRDDSGSRKVVIFDFDGTIVDSMEAFADIASRVMPKHYSITAERARELYLETSGIPFFQQLEQLFPADPNNPKAADEFEAIKLEGYLEKLAFDDVSDTVDELKRFGVSTVVSSNNFQELVEKHVKKIGVKFDMVLGYKKGFAKGEAHFAHIEDRMGVDREDMIFVGDSIKDGERAMASGIGFIGKAGTFSADEFRKNFPDTRVISSLSELKPILTEH